ncbi:hypothetical protein L6452_20547 [Arctium lappa]|uniref:Uncharacterized protein n=1 Tax=Arctium lappa TaxID=4217 RepID=A0ACB9BBQ3_ARCLA|nr:hypothetical protein L6452_20547 [Arctium lappa]
MKTLAVFWQFLSSLKVNTSKCHTHELGFCGSVKDQWRLGMGARATQQWLFANHTYLCELQCSQLMRIYEIIGCRDSNQIHTTNQI